MKNEEAYTDEERATNRNDVEKVGPVCRFHLNRIIRTDKRNQDLKTIKSKRRAKTCWMNPMETAKHEDDDTDALNIMEEKQRKCLHWVS